MKLVSFDGYSLHGVESSTQNTQAQNIQAQNNQGQNTQSSKIPKNDTIQIKYTRPQK